MFLPIGCLNYSVSVLYFLGEAAFYVTFLSSLLLNFGLTLSTQPPQPSLHTLHRNSSRESPQRVCPLLSCGVELNLRAQSAYFLGLSFFLACVLSQKQMKSQVRQCDGLETRAMADRCQFTDLNWTVCIRIFWEEFHKTEIHRPHNQRLGFNVSEAGD